MYRFIACFTGTRARKLFDANLHTALPVSARRALPSKSLYSPLPGAVLANLSALEYLDLSGNAIFGTLPVEMSSMK